MDSSSEVYKKWLKLDSNVAYIGKAILDAKSFENINVEDSIKQLQIELDEFSRLFHNKFSVFVEPTGEVITPVVKLTPEEIELEILKLKIAALEAK